MSKLIISVSGLRGIVGETLTPEVAMRYAAAFSAETVSAETAAEGPFVITRDGRGSGSMLADAVHAALNAAGRSTLDGGIAATPTTGILIRTNGAAGGLQISASHNPGPYNGIKLFSSEGRVIPKEPGAKVLRRYKETEPVWKTYDALGMRSRLDDTVRDHLDAVLKTVDVEAIRRHEFSVLLDSNRGAGSVLGERLLIELGCRFQVLGARPDGLFEHTPEPTAENLQDVCREARELGAAITFCQDPDADRLAVIDAQGRYLGEEYTVALCADHVLRTQCSGFHPARREKGPLVVNCATSRMTQDVAQRYGVPFYRSAVGEANVVDRMRETGAVFGGEGNGGPIDPKVGPVRDSFVGMAMLLDAMAARDKTIAELAAELPSYAIVKRKCELPFERIPEALDVVAEKLDGPRTETSRLDGVRIDFADSWVLLRASNTEPIVRIIAEAPTADRAEELCDRVESLIGFSRA